MLQNTLSIEQQYLQKLQDKYKEDEWFVRYQKNSTTGTYEPVFYSKSQIEDADYSEKPEHQSQVSDRMYMVKQPKQEKSKCNRSSRTRYIRSLYQYICIWKDADGNIKTDKNGNEVGTEYTLTATTTCDDNAYNDAMNQYNYNKTNTIKKFKKLTQNRNHSSSR